MYKLNEWSENENISLFNIAQDVIYPPQNSSIKSSCCIDTTKLNTSCCIDTFNE